MLFAAVLVIYIGLTGFTVFVLRRLAEQHDMPAPQDIQPWAVGR